MGKLVAVMLLLGVGAAPAFGWGSAGHRMIGDLAMKNLPAELPVFLHAPETAAQIAELAREPDRWRKAGDPHDDERDPAHFVHLGDDLTVMGGPQLKALPPTRAAYDTALRAAGATQYSAGYLPYAIIDGWQQLKTDFAYWRIDAAGEKFAKTAADRAWFAADRRLREMLIIRDLGVWSHYVGDASQPMHVSVHYGSWGNGPNPQGFSTDNGLHWRFEGAFVTANVAEADVAPLLAVYRDCACSIETRTTVYLTASWTQVAPLFRLEKARSFEAANPAGKAFAAARLAAAASELRDLVVDAWRASADARVGFGQIAVKDAEAGKPEALGGIRGD